ncbi:MAG: sulfatase-like hydrolase/transferase [Tannerella sp.]|jgi:arylsulfatase|nr:sulfatase-like hydrolase/transferase [Tannerella sp.]
MDKNNLKTGILPLTLIGGVALNVGTVTAQNQQPFQGKIGKTYATSTEAWTANQKASKDAPNVVWILIDDVGFGAASVFGGLIQTPNLENLANQGLRYTNFHTCAISAPTRAALLTGRNSHAVHMGGFGHAAMSAGFPGWDGRIPSEAGTIAEVLRDHGYGTFAVGKYGIVPDADVTDAGPFDRWPSGKGFDHFFGFLGSATDQYKPDLVEDNAHVTPDGRHLSAQITDKAIGFITRLKTAAPDKPFFLYYAPGATHSPHQVAREWSDKYKGKFDEGWDVYRERVIERQKKLGVIPANAQLPARESRLEAWDSLTPDQKKLYARFFENYAGYLEYTDYEIGRLINYLRQSRQLDNTAIFVIIGDNGASKEGNFDGTVSRLTAGKTRDAIIEYNLHNIDLIGTPESSVNYPLAWAQAANTPFKYWKQDAHSEGGTHNPLIVYYPKGVKEKGGIRNQYGHVIDLLPTTTDLIGIKQPEYIRGIKQDPIHGTSMFYSFNDAQAASRHTLQHYYIFGSRSLYKDGWKAATAHRPDVIDLTLNPQDPAYKPDPDRFEKDVWELYDLNNDFNELTNLAEKYPEKLKELKTLFDRQAEKYNLYPLIDRYDLQISVQRRRQAAVR